jgi:hypothetical protein
MAATTTLPEELQAPKVTLKVSAPATPAAPAIPTFDAKMNNARAIVYGTHANLPSLHAHTAVHSPKETFKNVAQTRNQEQQALQAKFHRLEVESHKSTEDSWAKKLAEADRRAAMIAQNRALPVSPLEAARGNLLRKKLAAQYRASTAAAAMPAFKPGMPTVRQPTEANPMDAHAFITGQAP